MGDLYTDSELNLLPYYAYHHDLAQRSVRAGAYSRAREEYLASLAAELNAPALLGIALLDAHEGDLESAYTTLMRARLLAPDDVEIEANLGGVLISQEREVEAKEHLDRAIELDPKNVRALTNRAIARARLGKPKQALEDLVEARALAKDTSKIDGMLELLRESGSL